MDGDIHSVEDIQFAIRELHQMRHKVRTHVFAEPGRERNEKWHQFFSTKAVFFHPVLRNSAEEGEANDEAISQKCAVLSEDGDRDSISLLVSDMGYLDMIQRMGKRGVAVLIFVAARCLSVLRNYRKAGVQVAEIKPRTEQVFTVRAVLHSDGAGRVELTKPCYPKDITKDGELCYNFLRDLGYVEEEREDIRHAAAKFWHTNHLGQITLFPMQQGIEDVCTRVSARSRGKWLRQMDECALVLPISARGGTLSKKAITTYSSAVARQVFRGGGPFMIRDSVNMVDQALTKLGYLDNGMNSDLAEAMLVFVNATEILHTLRKKLDALPAPGDTVTDVRDKLRYSFLSHLSSGQWRIARKDGMVRLLLNRGGFLANKRLHRQRKYFAPWRTM